VGDVASLEGALATDGETVAAERLTVRDPVAPGAWTLDEGRRVRDLWQGLRRLGNAGSEAESIARQLEAVDREGLLAGFARLLARKRDLEKRLQSVRSSQLSSYVDALLAQARSVGGITLLTARVEGIEGKALRDLGDKLRARMATGVIALVSDKDCKATMVTSVSKNLTATISAVDLIRRFAPLIGGKGGGNPELAQAGGDRPEGAEAVFAGVETLLAQHGDAGA
jgi:alanyl-tRNA synthetase